MISGYVSMEEFTARQRARLEAMKGIYGEIKRVYEQKATCGSFCFYITFTLLYFSVLFMQVRSARPCIAHPCVCSQESSVPYSSTLPQATTLRLVSPLLSKVRRDCSKPE